MDRAKLSRREVLAGLAVTGSSGALVGSGTGALFSDDETFTNNSIKASETTGGVLDTDGFTRSGTLNGNDFEDLGVSLKDVRGQNPAFICVKTESCPKPDNLDKDDLRVKLQLVCDGVLKETIVIATLREVLDLLQRGILLDCGDPCLDPATDPSVSLRFTVLGSLGKTSIPDLGFKIKFVGKQCRYNDISSNLCSTGVDCPPEDAPPGISFLAFCSTDTTEISLVELVALDTKTEDDKTEPLSVWWKTDKPVDYVVLFAGQTWTIYDYSAMKYDDMTSGVATTGFRTDNGDIGNTDADLFYGKDDSFKNFSSCRKKGKGKGAQSCPCEVASQELGYGGFSGFSVKYNYQEGEGEFKHEVSEDVVEVIGFYD